MIRKSSQQSSVSASSDAKLNNQPKQFGWVKTICFSLAPLIVLALVLEGSARVVEVFRPPMSLEGALTFTEESRVFMQNPDNPDYMMTNPAKCEVPEQIKRLIPAGLPTDAGNTFVLQHFTKAKQPATCRIFVVGESSVNYAHQALETMELTLWRRFPQYRAFEVINAGGCGYGSDRLVLLVKEILEFQPDVVVLYLGNNEFNEHEQLKHANLNYLPLQQLLWKSAVLRFVRDQLVLATLRERYAEHNERVLAGGLMGQSASSSHVNPEDAEARMQNFRNNLALMISLCAAQHVPVVLGTIPSNHYAPHLESPDRERFEQEVRPLYESGDWQGGLHKTKEILAATLRSQASDVENQIIRNIAEQYDVELLDMESRIIAAEPHGVPGETLFGDHCHLNQDGRNILADAMAEAIATVLARSDR